MRPDRQDVEIPRRFHGRVMNICFDFVQDPGAAIAFKVFSLTVLQKLAVQYPDILPELKSIVAAQWDQASPAFRSRAKRLIK